MASKKYFSWDKFLNGFTLLEIVIVTGIILIITAFELLRFNKVIERARATEAVLLLKAVHSAQLRYAAEVGQTTGTFEELAIDHRGLKYFNPVEMTDSFDVKEDPSRDVANISRKSSRMFGSYTLYINAKGDITCADETKETGDDETEETGDDEPEDFCSCENLGFTKK